MLKVFIRSWVKEIKEVTEGAGDWKYIAAAFLITIFMTSILVLLLPESPLEFW